MKKKLLRWCLPALIFSLLLLGCRNEDFTGQYVNSKREEAFFREALSKTSRLRNNKTIIEALKKQNERSHFVSKMKDQSGLPVWDKMLAFKKPKTANRGEDGGTAEEYVIPLTEDKENLSSILYITRYPDGTFAFNNIDNADVKQTVNDNQIDKSYREQLLSNFIVIDHLTFPTDAVYWNLPDDLFASIPESQTYAERRFRINIKDSETGGTTNNLENAYMYCYEVVLDDPTCGCHGTTPTTVCTVVVGSGGGDTGGTEDTGGGTTTGDPGGGGGGGGSPTGDPGSNTDCNSPNKAFYKIVPGCDDGGLPAAVQSLKTKMAGFEYYIDSYAVYLSENISIAEKFNTYLSQNNNQQGAAFVMWGLGFLSQNTSTSWAQFESWFIKGDMDYKNNEDVAFASNLSSVSYDLISHNQAGTLNQLDVSWPKMDGIKNKIKEKFKNSIPVAVKYAKHLFLTLKSLTDNYPVLLTYANKGIDKMRNEIHNEGLINYDVHTMKWKDVVGCWLFELGNYPVNTTAGYGNMPTLGFAGSDYVIAGIPGNASQMRFLMNHKTLSNGNPSPNSVVDIKKRVIERIKQGNLASLEGNWGFGFDATIDTISQLDGLQFCLGSYLVTIYVAQISTKTFELTFIVKNKTGWESGTRGLNNGDGNSSNDSVIPDKPRGQGLHLGGTIGETFGWKETITIP